MDSDLVAALRSRGVTVVTALDAGLTERSDAEQLAFATEHGCVLYSFNVSDFYRLHTQWVARACRDDSGAATAVLGWRAVAPPVASSRHCHHRDHAEPSRVPKQLGLTIDAPRLQTSSESALRATRQSWLADLFALGSQAGIGSNLP